MSKCIILLVTIQRLGELYLSRINTLRLLNQGAEEFGKEHYPLMVSLHASWLITIFFSLSPDTEMNPLLLMIFMGLQMLRIWVILTLGPYWTTRVISLPNIPLIKQGPYRYVRHPNYWIVSAEIAVLPLTFGFWKIAVIYSIFNGCIIYYRIGVEDNCFRLHNRQ